MTPSEYLKSKNELLQYLERAIIFDGDIISTDNIHNDIKFAGQCGQDLCPQLGFSAQYMIPVSLGLYTLGNIQT